MKQPTFDEFKDYVENQITMLGDEPENYTEWIYLKYMAWSENDWCKHVKGKDIPIKRWKTTLLQCLPYRVENKVQKRKQGTITERLLKKI